MIDSMHLTEEERQTFADGSMSAERVRDVESHLHGCANCAADVSRLQRLMTRASDTPVAAPPDDLWPSIRSRIEQAKIVPLEAQSPARRPSFTRRRFGVITAAVAAAAVLAVLLRPSHKIATEEHVAGDSTTMMIAVIDSVTNSEEEARALLNRLELQRAFLRPEAVAAIDRNLRSVDSAIAELKIAIENDPRNPALRRLLAQSYRHKIVILRNLDNAH